jgi:hypothetical protein
LELKIVDLEQAVIDLRNQDNGVSKLQYIKLGLGIVWRLLGARGPIASFA